MKLKGIVLVAASQLLLFSSLAHADVIFRSTAPNFCSSLAKSTWAGAGEVIALGGIVRCTYKGGAKVADSKDSTNFFTHVSLTKTSGPDKCPESEEMNFQGKCSNGVVSLHTDLANLSGTLEAEGTQVTLSGSVNINGIKADVKNMHLVKQPK